VRYTRARYAPDAKPWQGVAERVRHLRPFSPSP
jgi:hypothetical protein